SEGEETHPGKRHRLIIILLAWGICSLSGAPARAQSFLSALRPDPRIRVVPYRADAVYRLRGYVGYQIDITFAPGERFVGLGVGDAKEVAFAADANHLFLKPKAARVATNLTVLTNRRTYLFDYKVRPQPPDPTGADVIYALRFEYPAAVPKAGSQERQRVDEDLAAARRARPRNYNYWYCGAPSLKPIAAWDDGVQTTLVFGAHTALPAVFALNGDGSESLVNFDVRAGRIVVQRVTRRLILRRGRLAGCIVDRAFTGGGAPLASGTLAPDVRRVVRRPGARVGP
ncbi:MAG: TrbG/VirB9 family P-type conjugative transfer protein, partial [Proteobacteria bacterium]|nr:TrbG/VirB9 family P-type conjugative transfer protein [Pseudomonadota bacterium]